MKTYRWLTDLRRIGVAACALIGIGGAIVLAPVMAGNEGAPLASVNKVSPALDSQVKIESDLLTTFETKDHSPFYVHFAAQANLKMGQAQALSWEARGEYVLNALKATAESSQAEAKKLLDAAGLKYRTFLAGNLLYVEQGDLASAQTLAALAGVSSLTLPRTYHIDPPIQSQAKPNGPLAWGIVDTKADQFWAAHGEGAGIVVANIDTGVQWNHPALVNAFKCPGNPADTACWSDPSNICGGSACDNNGHGTHTMGTMVGANDPDLTYQAGMAPAAKWIACKGCEDRSCSDVALNACADWVLAPGGNPANRPHIVNNSWGGGGGNNWYLDKVNAWRAAGIFPAFSAGNNGDGGACASLGSPGDYQESFGTAAHDINRANADFSSRGPSAFGHDPYTKGNISAPGVNVCSSLPTDSWGCWDGTSMASPHSAGAVALLWSCNANLIGQIDQTFQLLQNHADAAPAGVCGAPPDGQGNYTFGYGYLDVLTAGAAVCGVSAPSIVVTPSSLETTQAQNTKTTKPLTIGNVGNAPLTWTIDEEPKVPVRLELQAKGLKVASKPTGPVSLILDDGVPENAIGIGGNYQFLFLNRFTPASGDFPFTLNQIQVYFSSQGLVAVGDEMKLVVYENTSGGTDPAPGSHYLGSISVTVTALDAWNVYDIAPISLNGPGDVLIGVVALKTPGTAYWPAAIDQTTSQQRSWAGWWTTPVAPDPPLLPPDENWTLIDAYFPGNWMVRGYGQTASGDCTNPSDVPWLSVNPTSGQTEAGGTTPVTVTFDSTGLAVGAYNANLCVGSNDPVHSLIAVPVQMTVTQAQPTNGLAVDFGQSGLWFYGQTGVWTQLSPANPSALADWGARGLAAGFGASGLYQTDGTTWNLLSPANAVAIATGTNWLAASFLGNGLWIYGLENGSTTQLTWQPIATATPSALSSWPGGLAADFGTDGLWNYDFATARWTQLSPADPTALGNGFGTPLVVGFGANGLWAYDGAWTLLAPAHSNALAMWGSNWASGFGLDGVWNLDPAMTSWTALSPAPVGVLAGWSNGLAADFNANGLWNWNGGSWQSLVGADAEGMTGVVLNNLPRQEAKAASPTM